MREKDAFRAVTFVRTALEQWYSRWVAFSLLSGSFGDALCSDLTVSYYVRKITRI